MARLVHFGIMRSQNVLCRLSVSLVPATHPTKLLTRTFGHNPCVSCTTRTLFQSKEDERNIWLNLGSTQGCFHTSVGCFSGKKVKIPPTKHLHFDYSGDLDTSLPKLDPSEPRQGFENLPELKAADEVVQKLFSLDFSDGREHLDKRIVDLLEKVQDHPTDVKSLETRITVLTIRLRNQMRHALEFRKDKAGKSRLIERIQARNKWLRILRTLDYEKFEWLLRELKIKHVPVVTYNRKESRQAERKRLAREEGKAIRQAKIAEFRERLEEEQLNFLEHREQEMADIEQQLKELGITELSTLEGALEALGMSHKYQRRPPYLKRRKLLLQKKFEQYGLKCKKKGKQAVVMQ